MFPLTELVVVDAFQVPVPTTAPKLSVPLPADRMPVTVEVPTTVRAFADIVNVPAEIVSAPLAVTALRADPPLSNVRLKKLLVAPWVIVGVALVSSIVPAAGVKVMPVSFQLPVIRCVKLPGFHVPAVIVSAPETVQAPPEVIAPPGSLIVRLLKV